MTVKLSNVFGYPGFPRYKQHERILYSDLGIGIEIEAENYTRALDEAAQADPAFDSYWELKPDGSLRNQGIELCSRVLFGRDIVDALESSRLITGDLHFNWRAGIHVHTDVSSLSLNDLIGIIGLYSLLEPLIFAWEGNNRDQCNFCIPWYNCNAPLKHFVELMKLAEQRPGEARRILSRISNVGKYTALNLSPITNFGSIEYRHMQSTPDVDRIIDFVNICSSITMNGPELSAPAGDLLSSIGEEELLADVLRLPFLLDVPDYHGLLWKGVSTFNLLPTLQQDIEVSDLLTTDDLPLI